MLDDLEDLLVGEPAVDLDRGPGEPAVGPDAVGVELHEGADGVAGVPRLEAGQAVGEDLREASGSPGRANKRWSLADGPSRRAGCPA